MTDAAASNWRRRRRRSILPCGAATFCVLIFQCARESRLTAPRPSPRHPATRERAAVPATACRPLEDQDPVVLGLLRLAAVVILAHPGLVPPALYDLCDTWADDLARAMSRPVGILSREPTGFRADYERRARRDSRVAAHGCPRRS